MRSAEELIKIARALPRAARRPAASSYGRFRDFVLVAAKKGHTGRAIVAQLVDLGEIPAEHSDRARHAVYRILRRQRAEDDTAKRQANKEG